MKPRTVLVLSHELPPLGGGAGRALAQLCAALAERGLEVTVWTQAPPAGRRLAFPFRVRSFATGRSAQFQTSIPTIALWALRVLLAAPGLRGAKPDLILSNTGIPAGCVGALLGRLLGVPHAVWYHGAEIHGNRPEGAGALYRALLRLSWRHTALHGFVSGGLLRMAEGFGGLAAPRFVLPLFADHVAPAAVLRPEGRTFLFAGRLEAVKDPFLFLAAIALLNSGGHLPGDVRFRIVGGGDLFGPVRARIEELGLGGLVSLEPPVPGDAMGAIYAASHALVLTSVVEGFPLTILEAALCGVPSVGPDTLGVNEEIEDGRTGLLFARGDAGACAAALRRLIEDECLRDELGANAREAAAALSSRRSAGMLLEMVERHVAAGG